MKYHGCKNRNAWDIRKIKCNRYYCVVYGNLADATPGKTISEATLGSGDELSEYLIDLMAYEGDHLSYYQDAMATEAYLGTPSVATSSKRNKYFYGKLMTVRDYSIEQTYFHTKRRIIGRKCGGLLNKRLNEYAKPDYSGINTINPMIWNSCYKKCLRCQCRKIARFHKRKV
jgi:hypothetical protein